LISSNALKFFLTGLILLMVSGCNESDNNALSLAQACLDQVPSSNPSSATQCMAPIVDLDSQQANILKCSIQFVAGGLTTPKVAAAYLALQNSATNKEALFITTLALTPASYAQSAAAYCNRTGVAGDIYIAQLSVIGSSLATVIPGYDPTTNTPPTNAQIGAALTTCIAGGCDNATIGSSVLTVGNSYCKTASADADVCAKITQSIGASDGTPNSVAQQLYLLLQ
jgi:hypothetical protein